MTAFRTMCPLKNFWMKRVAAARLHIESRKRSIFTFTALPTTSRFCLSKLPGFTLIWVYLWGILTFNNLSYLFKKNPSHFDIACHSVLTIALVKYLFCSLLYNLSRFVKSWAYDPPVNWGNWWKVDSALSPPKDSLCASTFAWTMLTTPVDISSSIEISHGYRSAQAGDIFTSMSQSFKSLSTTKSNPYNSNVFKRLSITSAIYVSVDFTIWSICGRKKFSQEMVAYLVGSNRLR